MQRPNLLPSLAPPRAPARGAGFANSHRGVHSMKGRESDALRTLRPRLLQANEGAAYFGLPVAQFERLRIGRACFGTKVRYDKRALDAFLDRLSDISSPTPQHSGNDPEAALDRFTARFANPSRRP